FLLWLMDQILQPAKCTNNKTRPWCRVLFASCSPHHLPVRRKFPILRGGEDVKDEGNIKPLCDG
ncbi:hypothetical protein JKW04_RS26610, partial [Escherichia coli]